MNVIYQLFRLNDEDGYFDLMASSRVGFLKLTDKLKTAPVQRKSYKDYGIKEIIHSKKSKKNEKGNYVKLFHNGLIPTPELNTYCGDHYEFIRGNKVKSFILFEFSKCGQWLLVHFAEKFRVFPNKRKRTTEQLLKNPLKRKFIDLVNKK